MYSDFQRTKKLSQLAYKLGMEFAEQEDYSSMPYLKDFNLFKIGDSKRIFNKMSQRDDSFQTKIEIFDYHYRRDKRIRYQTVLFINSKELGLPDFHLQPETFFHKLIAKLGFEDIDFESHPRFSDQYYLKGDDEDMIRNAFKNPILQYFTFNKNWNLEGVGYYLILYKYDTKISVKDVHNLYSRGIKLFDFFKNDEFNSI